MTNNELLLALSDMIDVKLDTRIEPLKEDMHGFKTELQGMKTDMRGFKTELHGFKTELQGFKTELQGIKTDMQGFKTELQGFKTELHGFKTELQGIKTDMQGLKNDISCIKLDIENDVKPDIKLLSENYVPAAKKYEKAVPQIEEIQSDVELLKRVVTEHSEKLQISYTAL